MTHAHQSKLVKFLFLKINCYFTIITLFIFIALNEEDHLSHLNISMLIDKNPVERYRVVLQTQKINWDSFKFKLKL